MRMAHPPIPKLIPINKSDVKSDEMPKTTLSEIMQSDSVKRLLSQPNIVVRRIPMSSEKTNSIINYSVSPDKSNEIINSKSTGINLKSYPPGLTIVPIQAKNKYIKNETRLSPSKKCYESEFTISPVKREKKICGHYESCETVVCNVAMQWDDNDDSYLLAVNIDENEINAPVSKHCKNEKCDTLNIDHDRCRRALIKLHKCDKRNICDICGKTFKTYKARSRHKSCKRICTYRHNENSTTEIWKERMRECELQMIENAKNKRYFSDHNQAMEMLKQNDELIIIPKIQLANPPLITTTTNQQIDQHMSTVNNVLGSIYPSIPFVLPQSNYIHLKNPVCNTTAKHTQPLQNQILPSEIQPLNINEWLISQAQQKTIITPIRVVPITNIISQPSLLHQNQGIPQFCLVADNVTPPITVTSTPMKPVEQIEKLNEEQLKQSDSETIVAAKKRIKVNAKEFLCEYCEKRFSTNWYFKKHLLKHKEKIHVCKICSDSFNNKYQFKKHLAGHNERNVTTDEKNTSVESEEKITNFKNTHTNSIKGKKIPINEKESDETEKLQNGNNKKAENDRCKSKDGTSKNLMMKKNTRNLQERIHKKIIKNNGISECNNKRLGHEISKPEKNINFEK